MNILIVDDERPARTELERMLLSLGVKGTISSAASADEAMKLFDPESTNAIFLDIEMPGGSGFDLLSRIGKKRPPVVFTTAYEQFAARAFEEEAFDYLLKPFGSERLGRVLARLDLDKDPISKLTSGDYILLKIDGDCEVILLDSIELMETTGNTTEVFWGKKSGRVNRTLKRLAQQLDPKLFFRCSRDQLVNLSKIDSFTVNDSGNFVAILHNKRSVIFSRRQSIAFRATHEF